MISSLVLRALVSSMRLDDGNSIPSSSFAYRNPACTCCDLILDACCASDSLSIRGRFVGSACYALALAAPGLDLRPGEVARDAHPVRSCAKSASTGVVKYHGLADAEGRLCMTDTDDYDHFVGIDWATKAHEVCLLDRSSTVRARRTVQHSGAGLEEFAAWLLERATEPSCVAVAIEIPRGAIVETLIERGFHVYAINPKQLDRFRDRHTVAGAKDDRLDAFVLADSLRKDRSAFRLARIDDPTIIRIRELSRVDHELGGEMTGLTNRLREQLNRFFPQILELCPTVDEPWIWALLEIGPMPSIAARLSSKRIQEVLRQHRIRRLSAEEVRTKLRAPALPVAPGAAEAASEHVALLIPRVRLVHEQRKACLKGIEALFDNLPAESVEGKKREHRDIDILLSLPGLGSRIAATMLAEASQPLGARDYHALRAHGGVAPVTRQSGKRVAVAMRRSCSGRLRNAFFNWARVASQRDIACRAKYRELRERGHTHARALRTIADRLLRILIAMLKSNTTYQVELAPSAAAILAESQTSAIAARATREEIDKW